MQEIAYSMEMAKTKFALGVSDPDMKYDLLLETLSCRRCVTSNRAVEYKPTKKNQQKTIYFGEEGFCDACQLAEKRAPDDRFAKAQAPARDSVRLARWKECTDQTRGRPVVGQHFARGGSRRRARSRFDPLVRRGSRAGVRLSGGFHLRRASLLRCPAARQYRGNRFHSERGGEEGSDLLRHFMRH
jgi:hypothetical protein